MPTPLNASSHELELKLVISGDDLLRLGDVAAEKANAGSHAQRRLRSVYFDTPSLDLQAARITLRLRNDGGDHWIQTVKAGEVKGGLSDVDESEALLDGFALDPDRIVDKRLRQRLKKIAKDTPLTPVFETIIDRTSYVIEDAGCVVELALDDGHIEAQGRTQPLRETELELLSGPPEGLLTIGRELFSGLAIMPGEMSKAERGYRLLLSEPATEPALPPGKAVDLSPREKAKDAFAVILRSCAEHIIYHERRVVETGEVEAVHQMRVGLTRLRSALRSLEPYMNAAWIGELEGDAQEAARVVGPLRDADVLIAEIYKPVAQACQGMVPGFPALLDALKAHRETLHAKVSDKLRREIWTPLLVGLILCPKLVGSDGELDRPVGAVAAECMDRRWKKVRKYGERIDYLDIEERHSMRKAMKKLRYNAEFFQSLYGQDAEEFIGRMKTLQDLFGAINDARLAEGLIKIAAERCRTDAEALASAGYIAGHHAASAPAVWSKAKQEWDRLKKAANFWR